MNTARSIDTDERAVERLDAWLSADEVFRTPPEVADQLRFELLLEAVEHHLGENPTYAGYAKVRGFDLDRLTRDSLHSVPLLPSGVFKRSAETVKTPTDEAVVVCTSSGTRGTISRVPRDNTTLMRFFASVICGVRELLEIEHSETFVFNVGPPVEESNHLWISYVMAGVSLIHETDFYVSGGQLEVERLVDDLRDRAVMTAPQVVVGPPPLILDAAVRLLEDEPLETSPCRHLVTIGGWKRREGEMVDREEFHELVRRAFGLVDRRQFRDAYNMVELNTAIVECAAHRKHCPPWVHVSALDPRTLEPVPDGRPGLLSFLDPTPRSFPGFIISDDFGTLERHQACECGIVGDVLTVERRVNRLESRGCALKM